MVPADSVDARRTGQDAVRSVDARSAARPRSIEDRRPAMGGTARIALVGGSPILLERCFELLRDLELRWSRFLPDSEISRLNRSGGDPVPVGAETIRLVVELVAAWSMTGGAFDPTTLPRLLELGYRTSRTDPSRQTVLPRSARWPGDVPGIRTTSTTVTLPRGTTLDPGGLGKGLAADLIVDFALDGGARGVLADIGGDLVVGGDAPTGPAWTIAIEDPFSVALDPTARLATVRLQAGAVATSSRLNRRFETAAGPAHHLIDPSSGHNPATGAVTATVLAGSGARAEALTKVAFTHEPAAAFALITSLGGEALILPGHGAPLCSAGWKDFL